MTLLLKACMNMHQYCSYVNKYCLKHKELKYFVTNKNVNFILHFSENPRR